MIPARILGTGSEIAGAVHTTAEVARRTAPDRDPVALERRTGIRTRSWVTPETSAASLGAAALRKALAAADMPATALRRLVFVSSTGGDHLIPATANGVAEALDLDDTCDAFDLNNACTGFLTALDVAARSVATGLGPVAVVVGETFSRYLPVDQPRSYLVFGDAAAAVVIGPGREGEGVLASCLRNDSTHRGRVSMAHPGRTRDPVFVDFGVPNAELGESALAAMSRSSRAALDEAGVALDEVAWFLPHQPNGAIFDALVDAFGVGPDRVVRVVDEIGSVGAASVPVSLDRLFRSGRVRPGDRLLMTSVGAGTAYGALLFRVAP